MHRMRILHLVGRSQRRGAETAALELAHELDALGHDNRVRACAPAFDGTRDRDLPPLVARPGMAPVDLGVTVVALARELRSRPVDVVLAHGGWAAQVAALAPARPSPVVVWQRILGFTPNIWSRRRRRWWSFVARRIDAAVALTSDLGAEVRGLGLRGPVFEIPNFRRPERFLDVDRARAGKELRDEIGVTEDAALLGLVGHLIQQKRPERALDVLARVRAVNPRAHLVVAGDGPLHGRFVQEARALGVASAVHVLGHRADVEQILGGIDLLLLTSDAEGIPGVLIEAQMAGCPIVTFPIGSVAAVVDDGRTGVVVAERDTRLMADHVLALLESPSDRARLGDAARRASARFRADSAAREYDRHLRELVATRRTR